MVQPIPEGFRTVTPYLVVDGAERLIDFLRAAFGAEERMRMPGPNGTIGHAEIMIGDSAVMLADGAEGWPSQPSRIYLYVEDSDATYQRAIAAGATSFRELKDEFYGDRMGGVIDPFGNEWWISTHVQDVSAEEMTARAAERAAQAGT